MSAKKSKKYRTMTIFTCKNGFTLSADMDDGKYLQRVFRSIPELIDWIDKNIKVPEEK